MMKIGLNHSHDQQLSRFWDAETVNIHPTNLFWRVEKEGFLARGFHLHPIMINPVNRAVLPKVTFDVDYLHEACPNMEDYCFAEDSDDLLIFGPSDPSDLSNYLYPGRYNVESVSLFVMSHRINAQHMKFFTHTYVFHTGEMSEKWKTVMESSDEIVKQICGKVTSLKANAGGYTPQEWHQLSIASSQAK
jgi:hypothetical protein